MAKVKDIIDAMTKYAPPELAEDWDNVGLMIGNTEAEAGNVLLCLDVTEDVINEAISKKCRMIVSHHPYIFQSMKSIDLTSNKGREVEKIIKNGISVYSAHTNLDYAEKGINYYLLKNISEVLGGSEMSLRDFVLKLKDKLNASAIKITYARGVTDGTVVNDVMSACGGFDGNIGALLEVGTKFFVVGEIKYNSALDVVRNGITIIEAGHYDTEVIILPYLRSYLAKQFGDVEFSMTESEFRMKIT